MPAPALVEAYAVLTRLPSPHRLSPADAWKLVKVNFVENSRIVALSSAALRQRASPSSNPHRLGEAPCAQLPTRAAT